jgi:hypothetical protein
MGSATISIELNEDNTLSTSAASIEDTTGENLLALIPGTEIFSKWLKLEDGDESKKLKGMGIALEPSDKYEIRVKATKEYYLITFIEEKQNLQEVKKFIDFDLTNGIYTISKKEQSSKDDKNKSKGIEFKGSVSLPEKK